MPAAPDPPLSYERMFYQGTILGAAAPTFDDRFGAAERIALDENTWVDWAPQWLRGADDVFGQLVRRLRLRQKTGITMYDRVVDEPRLSAWWQVGRGRPEPLPVLADMRRSLSDRYGQGFDSIGFNLYRDRHDSVAWHRDRHRHARADPVVAIVSVGESRPLRLRPYGGGRSRAWRLGHGDLFVMGGACQHDWEHCVPKLGVECGARMSITFRAL